MPAIEVDIVCLIYKGSNFLEKLYKSFYEQENIKINKVVFPITATYDEDFSLTLDFVKKNNIDNFVVEQEEFSHNLVREKAIKDYCSSKIVIMTTQDIELTDNLVFYNLVKDIDEQIVFSYSRQIAKRGNIERYVRRKNYPKESKIFTEEDIKKYGLMTFFASDACAAYNRDTFIKLNGYGLEEPIMMNEDMLYAKRIIDAGYSKKYCADSVVIHSHKQTLKQLYKRYYDAGLFFSKIKVFDEYNATESGFKLAMSVLGNALIRFDILVLLKWLPNMLARYLGLKKGRKVGKKAL